MTQYKLRNKYNTKKTQENWIRFKKQRNKRVRTLRGHSEIENSILNVDPTSKS